MIATDGIESLLNNEVDFALVSILPNTLNIEKLDLLQNKLFLVGSNELNSNHGTKIKDISIKLQRLLDGYLDQDIERGIYRAEKAKLISEKKTLEEKMANLQYRQTAWVEPMQNWIEKAEKLNPDDDLIESRGDRIREKVKK